MDLAYPEEIAVTQKGKHVQQPVLFRKLRVGALREAVSCRMMLIIIRNIDIDKPIRIPEEILAVPVPGPAEHFIDQPHVGRAVQVKYLPELCKRPHKQVLYKVLQLGNRRLIRERRILENVRAARPEATREEAEAALMAAQCGDILEKLPNGMDTVIGTEGTYLSGGEQQRVALARAILKNAPIVVLDEATAFADPENEALIQKAFVRLTEGRTVIMIAHRLSTVVNADRIVVLKEGRKVEEGSHMELVNAGGLYARMWADYNQAVKWRISAEKEAG